jgi:threonine/homoserine/homoserine lactone efflux protein
MLHATELMVYALAVLVMVITPGPNMLYCVSRTLCQGTSAGLVSVLGVQVGSVMHMLAASAGLSALLMAVPLAFDVIKFAPPCFKRVICLSTVRASCSVLV